MPLVIGTTLSDFGVMTIELPPWLLAASYALVGWSIGLRFNRPILVYAIRALPRLVLAISALIATCALFGVVLAKLAHVDLLTAYLATSPGGADTVAIIAASTQCRCLVCDGTSGGAFRYSSVDRAASGVD